MQQLLQSTTVALSTCNHGFWPIKPQLVFQCKQTSYCCGAWYKAVVLWDVVFQPLSKTASHFLTVFRGICVFIHCKWNMYTYEYVTYTMFIHILTLMYNVMLLCLYLMQHAEVGWRGVNIDVTSANSNEERQQQLSLFKQVCVYSSEWKWGLLSCFRHE